MSTNNVEIYGKTSILELKESRFENDQSYFNGINFTIEYDGSNKIKTAN